MSRLVIVLSVLSLSFLLLVVPGQSFAAQHSQDVNMSAQSKHIKDYRVLFTNVDVAPPIYEYDVAGWYGILKLDRSVSTGSSILAVYSGIVTCTGYCGLSNSVDK